MNEIGFDVVDLNWKNVDLNLLVAFSQLYQSRSVSAAAEKSYVSQSAMSHSLSRLRLLFSDPLFERKGHSMAPTDRAHEIAPIIETILTQVQTDLLLTNHFSPSQYSGVCRIGLTDYAELIFAPAIYDAIRQSAPDAQVSFINVSRHNYIEAFDKDRLDLMVGSITRLDDQFEAQKLYTEKHVCLYDPAQYHFGSELTLQEFIDAEHALISPDGILETQSDQRLKALGVSRFIPVASRSFLTVRRLIQNRKLIATVPRLMAQADMLNDNLTTSLPPISIDDFDISMIWNKARASDEKQIWLQSLVLGVFDSFE